MSLLAAMTARAESSPALARYQVETLSDFDSFLRLESIWNELLEQSGTSFPFVTHEWMRSWIEFFGAEHRLHMLLVKTGRTVVGIAPLMLNQGWMYGLPVTRLQSIHNVYTERFDFIINGSPEEIYGTIWNHLLTQKPRWDVLELRQVPSESPTLAHLTRLAAADHLATERWLSCESPYLPVEGSWESYQRTLSKKYRANLSNRLGRLGKTGVVDVEVIKDAEQAEEALTHGWILEAAAWKGQAGTAIGCHPRVAAFYEAFATRAARRGWLRLYFLRVDGRRIAFCYGLCFRNRMFRLKSGYDPRYDSCSPSMVLCSLIIKEAFQEGRAQVEFLGSNDGWKQSWTPTTQSHEWMFIFRPGLRSWLLRLAKFRIAPVLRRARRAA